MHFLLFQLLTGFCKKSKTKKQKEFDCTYIYNPGLALKGSGTFNKDSETICILQVTSFFSKSQSRTKSTKNATDGMFHTKKYGDTICSQLAITCSKLTTETLGQGVKYVES